MTCCCKSEDKDEIPPIRHALADLETEIIALQDIADILKELDKPPLFLAWCVIERVENVRKFFNAAWKVS